MTTDQSAWLDPRCKEIFAHKGYTILQELAHGAFGRVHLVERRLRNNPGKVEKAAVKVMDFTKMEEDIKTKYVPREVKALCQFKHPNTIKIYDIFKMDKKIFIFMEFASRGTIFQYVTKQPQALSEDLAGFWFNQLCEGLKSMHETLQMAHRDIKLENIMLDEQYNAKLTDFGFARIADVDSGWTVKTKSVCGTLPYFCPQLCKKIPYDAFKADVWASGVVLYTMLVRKVPFGGQTINAKRDSVLQAIKDNMHKTRQIPEYEKLSSQCKQLIDLMFTYEEDPRPSITQVLDNAWTKAHRHRPAKF